MVELSDDNDRTNSMGLFNTAEAFRLSATALEKTKINNRHAEMPVRFLYYHALELYLKALLRQKHSVEALSKKFGHKTKRLVKGTEALGLLIGDKDHEVFSLIADTAATIESRYIRTGSKTWPTVEALSCTCARIRSSVGRLLRENNVIVRL